MGYFLTFLAGMGFAALVDFVVQVVRRRMNATSERIADRVVDKAFGVDPDKVGTDQMARIRTQLGM